MKKFLTAQWKDLILASYEIDPSLLADRIPAGTELDLYDGKCYVSLVGFLFADTRVMEFLIPNHINFEEVNLRFYVKRQAGDETRRGVVFIKEIVPRAAIAAVARIFYGEPYERWDMSSTREAALVRYKWSHGESDNSLAVRHGELRGKAEEGSLDAFITEHFWGYTRRGDDRTDEYRVEHPEWDLYKVLDHRADVDFGTVYGKEFAHLAVTRPRSVILAEGSEVSVYRGRSVELESDEAAEEGDAN